MQLGGHNAKVYRMERIYYKCQNPWRGSAEVVLKIHDTLGSNS